VEFAASYDREYICFTCMNLICRHLLYCKVSPFALSRPLCPEFCGELSSEEKIAHLTGQLLLRKTFCNTD